MEFTGNISGMAVLAGAVQNGNTFTLTLKDGQSATFSNIPEGVTYTATESGLPNGYTLHEIRYSDDGKLTWTLQLAAGESKTVSFKAKVKDYGPSIVNQVLAQEGENRLQSNPVTTTVNAPVDTPSDNPQTGDSTNLALTATLMCASIACLFVLILCRKRLVEQQDA